MKLNNVAFHRHNTVVVGSGAAGLNAALRLYEMGQRDITIVTDGLKRGTSRNTGSDKQTYYKLSLGGDGTDSVYRMASTLFEGGCVDGDIAYVEAAGSLRAFFHLVELGVPFPTNQSGEYVGYKTDHDPLTRGTSAGPYTSKLMTEALERQVLSYGIPLYDNHMVVKLLTQTKDGAQQAVGVVALDQTRLKNPEESLAVFAATNVIWATGGEAGLYKASVYPCSQSGCTGLLLEAGATGKNLTESQYGIASTQFRWNLSGSFQQCIPRYISVNDNGEDEQEFLAQAFTSRERMLRAIFLKGYQWPFDPRKIFDEGSSYIDLLVYQEEVIRGRHVYLDYTQNPAALERDGQVDFSRLSKETHSYLDNCGALQRTPYERLKQMNPAAIQTYMDHHIDLSKEKLAISICAQHNNGGIAGNAWWESEIKHLFPIGEVNGSHGVYRPGGTALNAGQVGGLRAAQYITHCYMAEPMEKDDFLTMQAEAINQVLGFVETALTPSGAPTLQLKEELAGLQARMSRYGACIRSKTGVETAIAENRAQWRLFKKNHTIADALQLPLLFKLRELLIAQYVYLKAIENYIEHFGISRNSYLVYNDKGSLPHAGVDECFRSTNGDTDTSRLQEIRYDVKTDVCTVTWRRVRPLQEDDQWFERVWKSWREDRAFA